jgi:23S rRNA (cytosine1962-C5)-methyltransferase
MLRYAANRRVLDVFSYTGGFGIAALQAGCSSLTCIEISETATSLLKTNLQTNQFGTDTVEVINGNAFAVIRSLVTQDAKFDLIVLDPPAFCKSRATVMKACRGYKDINRLAMNLLNPDGMLITCSCSRPVSQELFQQVLWEASVEAGREVKLIQLTGQPPDHPVLLTFPESKYLKCATLLVH